MLVKLGYVWVNPANVDAITCPLNMDNNDILINAKMQNGASVVAVTAPSYEEAIKLVDEYAAIVNAAGAPSFPEL